jgi:hypothetical protein
MTFPGLAVSNNNAINSFVPVRSNSCLVGDGRRGVMMVVCGERHLHKKMVYLSVTIVSHDADISLFGGQ